jgi:hypothetical protein
MVDPIVPGDTLHFFLRESVSPIGDPLTVNFGAFQDISADVESAAVMAAEISGIVGLSVEAFAAEPLRGMFRVPSALEVELP